MFKITNIQIKKFLEDEKRKLENSERTIFGNFSVKANKDGSFRLTTFNKYGVAHAIKENINEFVNLPFYRDIVDLLIEGRVENDINKVINICHFELLLFSIMTDDKKLIYSKGFPLISQIMRKKFNRAKLFEINKNSIFFDQRTTNRDYKKISQKGFEFVEIPKEFSYQKLDRLTSDIQTIAKMKNIIDLNISLRIKKLGIYKTKGFYSKETNTMFLDPRYLEVWRHELAHYFVVKNNLSIRDEETFADMF